MALRLKTRDRHQPDDLGNGLSEDATLQQGLH